MEKPTILIVDDEQKNIKLLKAMLISENYKVFESPSGEEALNVVDKKSPDLILLDVMMPGISGFEVCRRLKQDEKTRVIPIIMVTALRDKEHRLKSMEVGADDFLSKPVDRTELLVRVKSLLRIKSYHDELYVSYRDIAEKNAKLHELEKLKEGLIHMIIHDLRNPLMVIAGNIEVILLDKQKLTQNQIKAAENCLESSHELNEMIQRLLDIHKMEEEKLQPDKKITDLSALIAEVLKKFIPKAESKQISVSFANSDDMPAVEVDSSLMKRVIANLLDNAIRHTPVGGKVDVAAGFLNDKGNLCISLKDTGNGLAPEYHHKIFDKFEQVGLKQAGIHAGTSGLGLAFCKMAIEAHGGRIWVESKGEGKGATFRFTVPI